MNHGPLTGFTVGVTAHRRAGTLTELLVRRGATVLHGPSIRIHPFTTDRELADATNRVIGSGADVVVVTTAVGFRSWLEAAAALGLDAALHDILAGAIIVTRGSKAAGAVVAAGHEVGIAVGAAHRQAVLAQLEALDPVGRRVAVQLDGSCDSSGYDGLRSFGAELLPVPVYRWSMPDDTGPVERLIEAACDGRLDAVTFTAAPAVRNTVAVAEQMGVGEQLRRATRSNLTTMVVGPVCAAAARDAGLGQVVAPEHHRLGSMVQSLTSRLESSGKRIRLGGHDLVLQGAQVASGTFSATLSHRERRVLECLASSPGTVVSKPALLRRVWGPDEHDDHLVEVTVARLRRRLGPAAGGVETVFRRGYRLDSG